MKNILLTLAVVLVPVTSFAGDPPPSSPSPVFAYTCRLDGDMSGADVGIGISGEVLGGQGMITCIDARHQTVQVPVHLTVIGAGPGVDFAVVRHVHFVTGGIGIIRSPMDLTGQFNLAVSAGVELIDHGYAITSAVSVKKHLSGLAFEMGFMEEEAYGLGAHLHGLAMFVNPIHHPSKH